MKKFFSLFILAASLLTLGVVSSCKDYNEDLYNDLNKAQESKLTELLDSIKALEAAKCNCGDIDALIEAKLGEKLGDYLKECFDNDAKLQEQLVLIMKGAGFQVEGDVDQAIAGALKSAALKNFIESVVNDMNPGGGNATIDEAKLKQLVDEYLDSKQFTNCVIDCAAELAKLQEAQDKLQAAIEANGKDIDLLKIVLGNDTTISYIEALGIIDDLQKYYILHDSKIVDLYKEIDDIKAKMLTELVWQESWNAIVESMINSQVTTLIDNKVAELRTEIEAAKNEAKAYTDQMLATYATKADLANYVTKDELGNYVTKESLNDYATKTALANAIKELEDELAPKIEALETRVAKLEGDLAKVSSDVEKVTKRSEDIIARLDAQITSIVLQGCSNPLMFNRTIALPFGIQSNVLFAYYGDNTANTRYFPSTTKSGLVEASGAPFTSDEMAGVERLDLRDEAFVSTAGKIYFTVNPSNCDFSKSFEGKTLNLYDSQNNACAIVLKNVQKSEHLVEFGFTRADNNNGFYEADAEIDVEAGMTGEETKLNIAMADLKPVGKDLLNLIKTRSGIKNLVVDAAKLALEAQRMPAYALGIPYRYTDSNTGVENTAFVYSNYAVAAASFKPLSYNFDPSAYTAKIPKRLMRHLPYLSTLVKKIKNKEKQIKNVVHFEFRDANMNITGFDSNIEINIKDLDLKNVDVTVPGQTVDVPIDLVVKPTVEYTYTVPQFNDDGTPILDENGFLMYEEKTPTIYPPIHIKETVKTTTGDIETTVNMEDFVAQINENIIKEINSQMGEINDLLANIQEMNKELNNSLDSLLSQTASDINGKVKEVFNIIDGMLGRGDRVISITDNFITKINNVLDRVYDVIEDPNHYLQPILLINNSLAGTAKSLPAYVRATEAGHNYAVLHPTTYTADLLNPAYKKFVKVTKVWDANGKLSTEAMNLANAAEYMNVVLDGDVRAIPFITDSKFKGYTYEIAYAAVDYSGYQSIQRFYVKVK